jgi:hypothetical protein
MAESLVQNDFKNVKFSILLSQLYWGQNTAINAGSLSPPFAKGGWGDLMQQKFKIPLNPPLQRGTFTHHLSSKKFVKIY